VPLSTTESRRNHKVCFMLFETLRYTRFLSLLSLSLSQTRNDLSTMLLSVNGYIQTMTMSHKSEYLIIHINLHYFGICLVMSLENSQDCCSVKYLNLMPHWDCFVSQICMIRHVYGVLQRLIIMKHV
jgi:hypothetical protein